MDVENNMSVINELISKDAGNQSVKHYNVKDYSIDALKRLLDKEHTVFYCMLKVVTELFAKKICKS